VQVENPLENLPAKSKNGKTAYTDEIAKTIIDACGSGFTLEKAAELVGLNPITVQGWTKKRPAFGEQVRMARKKHELGLLRSIELAGEKSWQAKAWMAERVYSYAQPSARLQVSGGVEHTAGGSFAALLAGLASRRAEKKAQVIEAKEVKAIEDAGTKYSKCCATNADNQQVASQKSGLVRKRRIKTRKPRAESLAKWPTHDTPPTTPPATDSHA
jgi:hypothetical protein